MSPLFLCLIPPLIYLILFVVGGVRSYLMVMDLIRRLENRKSEDFDEPDWWD